MCQTIDVELLSIMNLCTWKDCTVLNVWQPTFSLCVHVCACIDVAHIDKHPQQTYYTHTCT